MPFRLASQASDFETAFEQLLALKRELSEDVEAAVRDIIADVVVRGDRALIDLTARFDDLEVDAGGLRIPAGEIAAARSAVAPEAVAALELAHQRVLAHHERQRPEDRRYRDAIGAELGERWTPVDAAGLYVPGGLASYPSSVIMNAVPAKVAGVKRLVMVVPTRGGEVNPLVLVAAELAGVDEVYRIGGAQAIAALAYGTETIRPVATIVGPGNAYVAAAKRQVFGRVGIDHCRRR
jgi:histidinol dehydrogenase